ncbi:hypothetical protein [Paenibacillus sp. FSL W8-0194]|uniref:hypothetical protein n=1 Tax=Paenibacillus sp. FSL W8-0194 TaxID=2921711 RepID=UPI0030D9D1A3
MKQGKRLAHLEIKRVIEQMGLTSEEIELFYVEMKKKDDKEKHKNDDKIMHPKR